MILSLCRNVTDPLRQRLLKSQLVSIASCQRNLVKIIQKQMHLEEVYVTMKAKLSTQPSTHQGSTAVTQQPDRFSNPASSKVKEAHGCHQNGQRKESLRPVTQTRLLRPAVPRPPAPLLTATHTDVLNKKASTRQSSALQSGNTLQHINFQMKGNHAVIQRRAEDNSTHLSELIQRGVLSSGSALQLQLKAKLFS